MNLCRSTATARHAEAEVIQGFALVKQSYQTLKAEDLLVIFHDESAHKQWKEMHLNAASVELKATI